MKKIFLFFMWFSMMLCACNGQQTSGYVCKQKYEYSDFVDRHVEWNDILTIKDYKYFIYVYSPTCGHCNQIKNDILCYVDRHVDIYLIKYSDEIPIIENKEQIIGKGAIEELGIVGVPSLIQIENHIVTMNIVGTNAIVETLTNLP